MEQVFCYSIHHMPHPLRTDTRSTRTIFTLQALPLFCSTSVPGWAQDESHKHNFMSLFRPVPSPRVLLYPYDILCVNVKRSQSGMKKNLAPLTPCIWAQLIFFLKLLLVFQHGVQAHVSFCLELIQPLTGFSVRSFRKYFQLEVFAWGYFFYYYLFCPVLGISYRCFSYFGWKGY